MIFFSSSEDVNYASSADSNSLLGPGSFHHILNVELASAPFHHIPNVEPAPTLFHHIPNVEAAPAPFHHIPNVAPFHNGEYEALVRGFLKDIVSVRDYCNVLNNELFDITVFELKANLLEGLMNLLMSEPTDRLTQIFSNFPFVEPDRVIRSEALEFINDFMSHFHIQEDAAQSPFERRLVDISVINSTPNKRGKGGRRLVDQSMKHFQSKRGIDLNREGGGLMPPNEENMGSKGPSQTCNSGSSGDSSFFFSLEPRIKNRSRHQLD
ncbi:hypothetical protein WN944_019024 [Citrus x changshan-huyou]|uniref:Uncharacterized protein n=1 Tax=Citrus x changshan-huyou TaxID=2935761 RepID=A0AAP0QJ26_9ROSI